MQPDNQPNYWQNDQPQPVPVSPPVPPAPVAAQPVLQPIAQTIAQPAAPQPVLQPIAENLTIQPQPEPQIPAEPVAAPDPAPAEMYTPDPASDEEAVSDDQLEDGEVTNYVPSDDDPIHWGATEYIYREKGGLWFVIFALVIIGLIAVDIFFLKTYTFAALVAVIGIAFIVYTRRPPQEIDYSLSPSEGLYIGENLHDFSEYKSFGVINDHGNNFIKLIPIKRFGLGASVYFPTELGEQIVDAFGAVLPMEDLKLDAFDIVARTLRL